MVQDVVAALSMRILFMHQLRQRELNAEQRAVYNRALHTETGRTWYTSDADWRLGLNIQYCQGWMRQQQNQLVRVMPYVMLPLSR